MFSGWVYVGTVLWCHRSWSKGNGDIRAVIHIERFLFPPFFTKAFTLPIHRMLVWHFSFGERTIVLVGRHISSLPSFLGYSDLVGFPLSLQYGIHSGHEGHLIWGKKKKKAPWIKSDSVIFCAELSHPCIMSKTWVIDTVFGFSLSLAPVWTLSSRLWCSCWAGFQQASGQRGLPQVQHMIYSILA